MSHPQRVEVYRDGSRKSFIIEEVECGHFLDSKVARAAREAIAAGREAGLFISIVAAWRQHGEHQDGRKLELYLKAAEHDEFVALAAAHGVCLHDPAKPGHFVVSDLDVTPVEIRVDRS